MKLLAKRLLIEHRIVNIFYVLAILFFGILLIIVQYRAAINPLSVAIWLGLSPLICLKTIETVSSIFLNIQVLYSGKYLRDKKFKQIQKDHWPMVTFVIPSYNEPFEVASLTFDSILNLKYKGLKQIVVVDNSSDTQSGDYKKWEEYVGSFEKPVNNTIAKFIYNEKKSGMKPGNLDLAQEHLGDSDYVVFLDIDSTFPEDDAILEKSIVAFEKDNSLGWIQFVTRPTNYHFNSFAEVSGIFQSFLRITSFFRSMGGFTLFYGHNGIWKKSCLLSLGTWVETHRGQIVITEDLLKSIQAYNAGYYGKSLPVCTGEWVPLSLNSMETMWKRWTYGTCQIIDKYFKKIVLAKNMTLLEKFDLWHSLMFYVSSALTFPLPLIFLLFLLPNQTLVYILIIYIMPQVFNLINLILYDTNPDTKNKKFFKKAWDFYSGAFIISGFVAIVQTKGIINYLLRIPQGWKVTTKKGEDAGNWMYIIRQQWVVLMFALLLVVASIASWYRLSDGSPTYWLYYVPYLFLSFNLLLSVLIYGKSGKSKVDLKTIDIKGRNLSLKRKPVDQVEATMEV